MYNLTRGQARDCEGVSRREVLRIGGLGLAGLSLPGLLRNESRAAGSGSKPGETRSVILMWMQGGASHIDTFDPKPNAPAEVRGEFGVIPTALPGVQFSEHLPQLARNLDKFSVIRSGYSYNAGHGIADAYMLSGWRWTPTTVYPSLGSVAAKELGYRRGMPPYIQLGTSVDQKTGGGMAGYLGNEHNPFIVAEDPNGAQFNIDGIALPGDVNASRFMRRRRMLEKFDHWQARVEAQVSDVGAMDSFYEKAFGIVTSPRAKKAFDLAKEDPKLRDSYGRNSFGQSCLLARRLVEAGVRFVTVSFGGWDTHAQNFTSLKGQLLPVLDPAYATSRSGGCLRARSSSGWATSGVRPRSTRRRAATTGPARWSSGSAAAASRRARSSARATSTPSSPRARWCRPRTSRRPSTRSSASLSTPSTPRPTAGPSG